MLEWDDFRARLPGPDVPLVEYDLKQLYALALYRRLLRRSFEAWCCHVLAPLGQRPARHHRLIIAKLEAVARGEIDRMMLFLPPGSAKSTYASVLFPAWWLAQKPHKSVIASSYGQDLAEGFGRRVRDLIGEHAPALQMSLQSDNKSAARWATSNGGQYIGAGVGGPITGRRADLVLIDDPVKGEAEAHSDTVRQSTWDWYQSNLYTRQKPGAAIVLIMTRWHPDDLAGRLLAAQEQGGDQWQTLRLPALADSNDDPLGRSHGEPLWPEWEDAQALARKRANVGPRVWGSLYQQDPKPDGSAFFDLTCVLQDGLPVAYPNKPDTVFAVLDTATKTGRSHDGTAVSFWAMTKGRGIPLVCLDWDIVQIEGALLETWLPTVFQRLEQFAVQAGALFGSVGVWIEDKASGMVLIQQAARRGWPVTQIDSKLTSLGKDERAISVSGYVYGQQVRLSRHAYEKTMSYKGASANHFLKQVFEFRIGIKDQEDDLLDTFTYAIAIALGNAEGY